MLVSLACGVPTRLVEPTATIMPTVAPMTTEQAQQFENQVQATLDNPDANGNVTITVTEQQLNSYIAAQMASQKDLTIVNPQVHLTDNQIELTGQVTYNMITANADAIVVISIDENGKPVVTVQSMKLGSFPMPDALVSKVNDQIASSLSDYLTQNAPNLKVNEIQVSQGQMTVSGKLH